MALANNRLPYVIKSASKLKQFFIGLATIPLVLYIVEPELIWPLSAKALLYGGFGVVILFLITLHTLTRDIRIENHEFKYKGLFGLKRFSIPIGEITEVYTHKIHGSILGIKTKGREYSFSGLTDLQEVIEHIKSLQKNSGSNRALKIEKVIVDKQVKSALIAILVVGLLPIVFVYLLYLN